MLLLLQLFFFSIRWIYICVAWHHTDTTTFSSRRTSGKREHFQNGTLVLLLLLLLLFLFVNKSCRRWSLSRCCRHKHRCRHHNLHNHPYPNLNMYFPSSSVYLLRLVCCIIASYLSFAFIYAIFCIHHTYLSICR